MNTPAPPPNHLHLIIDSLGAKPVTVLDLLSWKEIQTSAGYDDYANSVAAMCIALDGNGTGLAQFGYKICCPGLDINIPCNLFPHPEKPNEWSLHLYRPMGQQLFLAMNYILENINMGNTTAPLSTILRRWRPDQLKTIAPFFRYGPADPWFEIAPYEDDTFGESYFDPNVLVNRLNTPEFRDVRLRCNRFNNALTGQTDYQVLRWESFNAEIHDVAIREKIVGEFFRFDDEKKDEFLFQNIIGT